MVYYTLMRDICDRAETYAEIFENGDKLLDHAGVAKVLRELAKELRSHRAALATMNEVSLEAAAGEDSFEAERDALKAENEQLRAKLSQYER